MHHPKKSMEALGRLDADAFREAPKLPLIIVLDDIRSGLNVGSVFRTADAYRVTEVRLCGITAQPPQKEILKTALGATESVAWSHWESVEEAVEDLRSDGWKIAAIEQAERSESLGEWSPGESRWAAVLGNEVHGVRQEVVDVADAVLELPQFGTKHSLNVSVCAGIVIWEWHRHAGVAQ